jgi:monothiol glutaredoxin
MDESVRGQIESTVKKHKVVLYMKGNRSFPQCGFSATVVSILNQLVPKYETVNVLADPKIRDAIKEYSQWPTIPQLYVDGEFVGGCDIVKTLHASGELKKLLGDVTASVAPSAPGKAPAITLSAAAARAFGAAAASAPGQVLRMEANERFQYELYFGDPQAGDLVANSEGLAIHVDAVSAPRLEGVTIDFHEDARGGGFRITNPQEPPRVKPLSPQGLKTMLDSGAKLELFDVRTPEERRIAAIAGARHLDEAGQAFLSQLDRATPLVFHCHHGVRSAQAAQQFLQQGFKEVYNLEGGIDAWSQTIDPSVRRY